VKLPNFFDIISP